ncbi:FAD/NAD(P)-binding protein [Microtetraspora malaysiensis]|uniref:FAD/NAD(P)-binding protein n=1 Tax=Microtetraspora malaysiensis TaxID=161358 RepID=UPI003D89BA4A
MHPMTPAPYRVRSRRPDRADTVTLTLEPLGGPCPPYLPGQFTMLYARGVGEIPLSISGGRLGTYAHTIRAVGAVSHALCRARRGDVLGLRGPYGTAWDVPAATGLDVVVAAGGLGLAALRPVVRELAAHRSRYGRISLIVGTRAPMTLLYPRELARWRDAHDIDVQVTVDHPDPAWKGPVGLVTRLIDRIVFEPRRTASFVCGPEAMMRAVADDLLRRGVRPERVVLSLERNMKCGVGRCGHCQLGPLLLCLDGPVLGYDRAAGLLAVKEL